METKHYTKILRGHHLYGLYKAYQLGKRGKLKLWDYLAKKYLYGMPFVHFLDIPDKVFGDTPEQIKKIKQSLDMILENPGTKIIFTNLAVTDAICENCPKKCPPTKNYSGQDDYALAAAGLEVGKPYTLNELSKVFSERYEKWAGEYELACFDTRKPFFSWDGEIASLKRKRQNGK